jgi:glyoxylase-like metal-dependent hydrolase (beta-lactamase superfamily II)
VRYLIYTHHHWDHVFGAQIFDTTTIGHDRCREFLRSTACQPWSHRYIARCIEENPRLEVSYTALMNALGDEQAFQVCVPSLTFSHQMQLVVDDLTIELEHIGGQHATDSIVVRIPEAGVMFLGDCYYTPPLHLRTSEAVADWMMLESLFDERYEWYIEGHNLPQTRKEVGATVAEMKAEHIE